MSIELVSPKELTQAEIQNSLEFWELYRQQSIQINDIAECERAWGHIKALRQLADKLPSGEVSPSGSLEESRRRHKSFWQSIRRAVVFARTMLQRKRKA